jgi:hypothetical protein
MPPYTYFLYFLPRYLLHCKKRLAIFPSLAGRDVTTQTFTAGNNLINYSHPERVWLVTSYLEIGKSLTFSLQCTVFASFLLCCTSRPCTLYRIFSASIYLATLVPAYFVPGFLLLSSLLPFSTYSANRGLQRDVVYLG